MNLLPILYPSLGQLTSIKRFQSVKHFLGPKNQEIRNFLPQKSGGNEEFFSTKSNDFIQNYKYMAAFHSSISKSFLSSLCKLFQFMFWWRNFISLGHV